MAADDTICISARSPHGFLWRCYQCFDNRFVAVVDLLICERYPICIQFYSINNIFTFTLIEMILHLINRLLQQ